MIMKRFLILAMVGACWAGIAAAAETTSRDTPVVIGMAAIDLQNPWFVRMKEAGDKAAKDYNATVVWQSAEANLEKEISIVESFINQGVDSILIDPLDKNALLPVIAKAQQADIPVITGGNHVLGDGNHSTLYPDDRDLRVVARALGLAMDGKGQVAFLVGTRGNYVSDTREKAFTETLATEFPEIELVGIQPTDWNTTKAADAAQTWLTTYPNLRAIACVSDSMCLAANSVAEALGRDIIFAGDNGDEEMMPLVESGKMIITVLTSPQYVGYWNIALAARLARGETFPDALYMKTHYIMSDKTAAALRAKGLDVPYITPEQALIEANNVSTLTPDQPASVMTTTP
jgi:ribose transport system substrate-binding protein